MSYRKSTKSNFASILSSLVIFMLVALVVGFLFVRTDGLTTGYKEFYVQCGNDKIISDRDNFSIVIGREYKFDVVNEKDGITQQNSNYLVRVVPNITSTTTFSFTADGVLKNYSDIDDLAKCFSVNARDNYFEFTAFNDLTAIMKILYKTDNISDCPTAIDSGFPYFRLVITNIDSGDIININFNIKSE